MRQIAGRAAVGHGVRAAPTTLPLLLPTGRSTAVRFVTAQRLRKCDDRTGQGGVLGPGRRRPALVSWRACVGEGLPGLHRIVAAGRGGDHGSVRCCGVARIGGSAPVANIQQREAGPRRTVEATAGFTSADLPEAEAKRALLSDARRLVVLADHTAWGLVGRAEFAGLSDAEVLVSDEGRAAEARRTLRGSVGALILATSVRAEHRTVAVPDDDRGRALR